MANKNSFDPWEWWLDQPKWLRILVSLLVMAVGWGLFEATGKLKASAFIAIGFTMLLFSLWWDDDE